MGSKGIFSAAKTGHLRVDSADASVNNPIDSNFQEPGFPQVRSFLLKKGRESPPPIDAGLTEAMEEPAGS